MARRSLLPWIVEEGCRRGDAGGVLEGAALFADVSGFTALTERLMRHGREGAEELARVLTWLFEPMVQAVHGHGGDVVSFAGDGLTAFFPAVGAGGDPAAAPGGAQRRAIAAALEMRDGLAGASELQTRDGPVAFAVKVGLDGGSARWLVMESGARRAYAFHGAAIDGCAAAEHLARPWDVVATRALLAAAGIDARVDGVDEAHVRLAGVPAGLPARLPVPPRAPDPGIQGGFFPAALLDAEARGELRWVVTLFVGLPQGEAVLAAVVRDLFELQERFGGFLAGIDTGDKGCTLLCYWGAPQSFEHDAERALDVALELRARHPGALRAGVTRTLMFAGFAGGAERVGYSCYGRGVNLAARLMMRAPWGEVWLDEGLAREATSFELEPVGSLELKGFATTRPTFALRRRSEPGQRLAYRGAMVGREDEVARALAHLGPALASPPSPAALMIAGEPGIGKSRLAHELRRRTGDAALWLECLSTEVSAGPLQPVRRMVQSWAGQAPERSPRANHRRFEARLRALRRALSARRDPRARGLAGELARLRPALAELAGLAPGAAWARMDPRLRFENMVQAVAVLLAGASLLQPVVVLADDLQWMDAPSRELLREAWQPLAGHAVALVATSRLSDEGAVARLDGIEAAELLLAPLGGGGIAAIAAQSGGAPLPPALLARIAERTGGNPYFVEQLVLHLRESGRLEEMADDGGLELPSSIAGVLVARLDRLAPSVKHVVQTASVLGSEFELPVLQHMLGSDPALDDRLRSAARAAIWSAVTDVAYVFRHNLMRDAAYGMQLSARRQEKHRLAAAAYEALHPDGGRRPWAELAHHHERGGDRERGLVCLERAADAAAATFANDAAEQGYRRVVSESGDATARIDAGRKLAEVLVVVGKLQEAEAAARGAIDASVARGDGAREGAARALRAQVLWRQGAFDASLEESRRAAAIALAQGDHATVAEARRNAGVVLDLTGRHAEARAELLEALAAAERAGVARAVARVLGSLGVVAWNLDDPDACMGYHRRAREIHARAGDRLGHATATGSIGVVHREAGRMEEARACYEEALATFLEIGSRVGAARQLFNLGNMARFRGDHAAALPSYERALPLARASGERALLCQLTFTMAACMAEVPAEEPLARELAAESLALAEALGWDDYALAARVTLARLAARSDPVAAAAAIERLCEGAEEDWPLAAAREVLWRLTGEDRHRRAAAALHRAMFDRTGKIEMLWAAERLEAGQGR